jgi:hypothetical protein
MARTPQRIIMNTAAPWVTKAAVLLPLAGGGFALDICKAA